jgi:hypothetical protein
VPFSVQNRTWHFVFISLRICVSNLSMGLNDVAYVICLIPYLERTTCMLQKALVEAGSPWKM